MAPRCSSSGVMLMLADCSSTADLTRREPPLIDARG
jgi:hypothetical protein